jgi:hypothetical protein
MLNQLKQKDILGMQEALQQLPIRKINVDGKKVKVVRNTVNEYAIYNNGYYITADDNWQKVFELVKILLNV